MGPCEGHFSGFRLDVVSQLYASTDQPEGAVYVCFWLIVWHPGPNIASAPAPMPVPGQATPVRKNFLSFKKRIVREVVGKPIATKAAPIEDVLVSATSSYCLITNNEQQCFNRAGRS